MRQIIGLSQKKLLLHNVGGVFLLKYNFVIYLPACNIPMLRAYNPLSGQYGFHQLDV